MREPQEEAPSSDRSIREGLKPITQAGSGFLNVLETQAVVSGPCGPWPQHFTELNSAAFTPSRGKMAFFFPFTVEETEAGAESDLLSPPPTVRGARGGVAGGAGPEQEGLGPALDPRPPGRRPRCAHAAAASRGRPLTFADLS